MVEHKAYDVFEENGKFYFYGKLYDGERGKFGPYDDRDKAEWDSTEAEAREC